ncbi:glycosyl transferase family 1 [Halothiobacillus diazotrophicus]|uniref:Glycosyl transferase family 1 n=1 Tax=Halothiobacillus diazotrophicus TaxID=1860122 RepID=A0A191ZFF5_9GAMM|nr:glycosyltransferase family 1 protein [Halothiobacillus diazotrophicus]ANJ66598.1 glycosyl transferase family 1 [Halothiobacillus diazotrophicus]
MTNVIIDITRLVDRAMQGRLPTGVDRVSLAYVRHVRKHADALVRYSGRWIILQGKDARTLFSILLRSPSSFSAITRWIVGKGLVFNHQAIQRGSILLNTGHSGLDDPDYTRRIAKAGLKAVYFLHDLIPLTHPEFCRPGESIRHAERLRTMLSSGAGLLMNSKDTRLRLLEYAAKQGVTLPPHAVAMLGPARMPPPEAARPLLEPYFVVLGTIEPRKNHLLLLHLWRDLVAEFGEDRVPRLVVIGQRGWECEQVIDLLDRSPALKRAVIELPHCLDDELTTWLAHAQALLFPAFVEGYGMPLIEAFTAGCPVIASNLRVFRELAADIPDYIHPLDGKAWREAILDYSVRPNSDRRSNQLKRIRTFKTPTWKDHFIVVDRLIESLTHHE